MRFRNGRFLIVLRNLLCDGQIVAINEVGDLPRSAFCSVEAGTEVGHSETGHEARYFSIR